MTPTTPPVVYPDSDGRRMADNDEQFLWLTTIKDNLDDLYRDRPDIYVAGDHLIYAEEGKPKRRRAPDVYVALGRPKRKRGSYKVWEEGGVFPQVVFEIRLPGDRAGPLGRKLHFYRHYGAVEYYLYDPKRHTLTSYRRTASGELDPLTGPAALVSLLLDGVRFDLSGPELVILRPDGQPFTTSLEIRRREREQRKLAEAERRRANAAQRKADAAQKQIDAARQQAEADRRRANALAAKLRALGLDPDAP